MKIATWNINSIRLRKENVINFLKKENIDILCLQEAFTCKTVLELLYAPIPGQLMNRKTQAGRKKRREPLQSHIFAPGRERLHAFQLEQLIEGGQKPVVDPGCDVCSQPQNHGS